MTTRKHHKTQQKSVGGAEASTTYDIQSYQNKVAIAIGDNTNDYTLSERSAALISGLEDQNNLTRPDDGLLTRPGISAYNTIDIENKNMA